MIRQIGAKMKHQTVVLCMICKNEAHVIRQSLESVYRHVDAYSIDDTGSTDDTKKIIKEFFDQKGIPGIIWDTPWQDFGTNRTIAFRHAELSGCDYCLVLDADDLWVGDTPFPKLASDTYQVDMVDPGGHTTYKRKQIFRNFMDWRYVGVLHEHADSPMAKTVGILSGHSIL